VFTGKMGLGAKRNGRGRRWDVLTRNRKRKRRRRAEHSSAGKAGKRGGLRQTRVIRTKDFSHSKVDYGTRALLEDVKRALNGSDLGASKRSDLTGYARQTI